MKWSENVLDILEGHGTSIPFIFAAYFKCAKIKGARKKGSIFKIIFSLGSALSRSNFIISRTRVEIYADIFIALVSYFSNESLSLSLSVFLCSVLAKLSKGPWTIFTSLIISVGNVWLKVLILNQLYLSVSSSRCAGLTSLLLSEGLARIIMKLWCWIIVIIPVLCSFEISCFSGTLLLTL